MSKLVKFLNMANRMAFKDHPPPTFARHFKLEGCGEQFILEAWKLFRLLREPIDLEMVREYVKRKKEGKDTQPLEYIPSSLRKPIENGKPKKRRHVEYAGGYRKGNTSSYGMMVGPNLDLIEVLEWVPEISDVSHEDNPSEFTPVIVKFNLDGTEEVIYKWKWKSTKWIRVSMPKGLSKGGS